MGNLPSTISCNGDQLINNGDNSLFLGPATSSFFWIPACGQQLSGGSLYQMTQATSWYDCVYSCDQNNLCNAVEYDSGVCKQYANYVSYGTTPDSSSTQLMIGPDDREGSICVPGEFNGYSIECGSDYSGGDIGSQHDISFKDCIALCDSTTGCIDVAYNARSCYLKGSLGAQISNPNVWTAKKQGITQGLSCVNNLSDGVTYNGYQIKCGADYAGGDIASVSTPTLEKCIEACSTTSGCIDVSYNGNMCYMKGSIGQLFSNGAVITALKSGYQSSTPPTTGLTCVGSASDGQTYTTSKGVYIIHCDADYFGGDLSSEDAATFADCVTACDNAPGCIDVSYTGHSCYLKNQLNTLKPAGGVWTAVLQSAASPPSTTTPSSTLSCTNNESDGKHYTALSGAVFEITCGVDYYGGDLAFAEASTFQACLDECDSTSGCVDVAYRGVACYMKDQATPGKQDGGVWGAKLISRPASNDTEVSKRDYRRRNLRMAKRRL